MPPVLNLVLVGLLVLGIVMVLMGKSALVFEVAVFITLTLLLFKLA